MGGEGGAAALWGGGGWTRQSPFVSQAGPLKVAARVSKRLLKGDSGGGL